MLSTANTRYSYFADEIHHLAHLAGIESTISQPIGETCSVRLPGPCIFQYNSLTILILQFCTPRGLLFYSTVRSTCTLCCRAPQAYNGTLAISHALLRHSTLSSGYFSCAKTRGCGKWMLGICIQVLIGEAGCSCFLQRLDV